MLATLFAQSFWIFLPSGIANGVPSIIPKITNKFDYPLDCYKSFRGIRIFGDHKTIRGFIVGSISAQLVFMLQLNTSVGEIISSSPNFGNYPWFYGMYIGFFALSGDAIKSFFKRRVSIPPGKSWFPFDQIDWLLGSITGYVLYFKSIPLSIALVTLVFGLVIHLLSRVFSYLIGVEKFPI